MKVFNSNEKKQYETPTMELLVITGRDVMESHDNDYVDWGELVKSIFPTQGYYDE